ncbi:MAG: glycosyltransferase family 4 protein [Alphaproteobacteria bacterium]|nr:glycosyltransferase family 4 protein [Alphaproteobacteria bacterium]
MDRPLLASTGELAPALRARATVAPLRLRVAAYTGGRNQPAARTRVRQYIPTLARLGIEVTEHWPHLEAFPPRRRVLRPPWLVGSLIERLPQIVAGRAADISFFQRELISTLPSLERLTRRPRVIDVDDAIHLHRGGAAARHLARLADLVLAGNAWLAEIWRGLNPAVEILPTPVDTGFYRVRPAADRPAIGWIGTSGNLPYLAGIAPALAQVCARFPGVTIAVCSDRPPDLGRLPVRFVKWRPEIESDFLGSLTIGVMPLIDGPWERGKCSFKMLQYMAAGRPCVVSPVGMNAELLREAELGLAADDIEQWAEALSSLLADRDAAARMGNAGRALAEKRYSVAALAPRLAELLRRVA